MRDAPMNVGWEVPDVRDVRKGMHARQRCKEDCGAYARPGRARCWACVNKFRVSKQKNHETNNRKKPERGSQKGMHKAQLSVQDRMAQDEKDIQPRAVE